MYLSQVMFRSVRGSILTYFLIFVLGLQLRCLHLPGFQLRLRHRLVGFFMWLNSKIGGTKAYRVGIVEAIAVFLAMYGLAMVHEQIGTAATIAAWIFLSLALNFGITGVVNATDYAYSFIPDVDEILTGKRREASTPPSTPPSTTSSSPSRQSSSLPFSPPLASSRARPFSQSPSSTR